jgi:hypothetical protein
VSPEVIEEADVVDVVEITPAPVQDAPSVQLVRRERRSEVLRPLDPGALLESFQTYQQLLQRLLTPEDWQGRPNADGSFVKKRGWRKIATAFDLDVQIIRSTVERDDEGKPVRAEVWARAIAPSGRAMDGDGYCDSSESRFQKASGRQKLENDLRATATTRAKNRAIADLVGLGAVSAEEVDSSAPGAGEAYGAVAQEALIKQAATAIGFLCGCSENDPPVKSVFGKVSRDAQGYLPFVALRAIGHAAGEALEAKKARDAEIARAERLAAEHERAV